jgi:hypothetical protein
MILAATLISMNATDAQIRFINVLTGERVLIEMQRNQVARRLAEGMTKAEASDLITKLKGCPKAAPATLDIDVTPRARVTEEGFYKNDDGFVFKVVFNQFRTRLYAKQTTARGLVYIAGAMGTLFADQKMTGEEIAAHGQANCYCVNCSTELTDPTSKHIGLGTSCGPAILGKDGYKAAKVRVSHHADVVVFEAAKKADAKARREAKKNETEQLVLV